MKTITMTKTYLFSAGDRIFIEFKDGETYHRVTEAQSEAILAAKAGFEGKAKDDKTK